MSTHSYMTIVKELLLMPIAGLFNQLRCEFIPNDIEVKVHSSRHRSK